MALVVKNPGANAGDIGDTGFDHWARKIPGGRHGTPLHYSCLENRRDRGAWRATVHSIAKSWTQLKRFSMHTPSADKGNGKCFSPALDLSPIQVSLLGGGGQKARPSRYSSRMHTTDSAALICSQQQISAALSSPTYISVAKGKFRAKGNRRLTAL